jgi:hypothetical protein
MSETTMATVRCLPENSARACGFGRYPSSAATERMRSRVAELTRFGLEKARETVDVATPAALATS